MAGLQGIVVLVTGGAGGMGRATAERFLKGGATVVILDLPTSDGATVAKELGGNCSFVAGDVGIPKDVERALATIQKSNKKLDVLVNSAGIIKPTGNDPDLETLTANVKSELQVAAVGAMIMTHAAAKLMQQNVPGPDGERGVIVNIGGIAGLKGFSGIPGCCGVDGYINSMTRALAKDLAVHGIRVNCVNAGITNTPQQLMTPEMVKRECAKAFVFPKRNAEPDEIASLIQHIVENKYINGAALTIDGGTTI